MKFIPKYRVKYNGKFYEAGQAVIISAKDADAMKRHGKIEVERSEPPVPPVSAASTETKRAGRPRRAEHGQPSKAKTENG